MIKWILAFLLFSLKMNSQDVKTIINDSSASVHLTYLAADNMKGRANYSAEQFLAAKYLASQFYQIGLDTVPGHHTFFHPFRIIGNYPFEDSVLFNIVGILPGRKLNDEIIVYSAHYDHIGTSSGKDSIYNGANDNASGTTAILLLADYFKRKNDNERTIMFCLFAGEELGLYGSRSFVENVDIRLVKAVINIEMIGRSGAVGKNKFFLTGIEHSNLARIMQRDLKGDTVAIRFRPERNMLFMRSDNYPFALKGIVAHSVMASDDQDRCYHRPCDNIGSLDMPNMVRIIRAIARGSKSLLNGSETPRLKFHR